MMFLATTKLSALPGRGLNVTMARSSFAAGGLEGATARHMNSIFGTSTQWKFSRTKGLGSARWYAIGSLVVSKAELHYGTVGVAEVGGRGKKEAKGARERRNGAVEGEGTVLGSLGCDVLNTGSVPLAAQPGFRESVPISSLNELKTGGGLDEAGPLLTQLNQPKGALAADIFLLLPVALSPFYCRRQRFPGRFEPGN
jgi:hypothetical protein